MEMPELPEVETVRRGLEKQVLNKRIANIRVFYAKTIINEESQFINELIDKVIKKIDRRGKYLLFRFSNDLTMISHLRMEGKYFVEPSNDAVEKHTHVIFDFTDEMSLRYNDVRKFGRMQLVQTGTEMKIAGLAKLGPEPENENFRLDDFYNNLHKRKKAIKNALLDQTIVAGLGNIYADEVLWMSKIHPETSANKLTLEEVKILRTNVIEELRLATKAGGTTVRSYTDSFGRTGDFQFNLHAYHRTGELCERCGTPIERIVVGQRGTHFCPTCQVKK